MSSYSSLVEPTLASPTSAAPRYSPSRSPPPIYSSTHGGRKSHRYELKTKDDKSWATLKIRSRSSSSTASNVPNIFEGSPITGSLKLNLEREESIKSIHLTFQGHVHPSAEEKIPIVTVSSELWSINRGDPSSPSSPSTSNSTFNGKLKGRYTFRFSLDIPSKTTATRKGRGLEEEFSLPPSYQEKNMRCTIDYRVFVTIKRGAFKSNSEIGTTVVYNPITIPEPFSPARRSAYQEGQPLMGPDKDPDGWFTLPPRVIRGTVFSSRNVEVAIVLSMAKPLSYTRGSVIPLCVTIMSDDTQALDLLARPGAIDVRLHRTVHLDEGSYFDPTFSFAGIGSDNICRDEAHAEWWSLDNQPQAEILQRGNLGSRGKRILEGEIQLSPNLFPSCRLAHSDFGIYYSINVYPMTATAFKLDHPRSTTPVLATSSSSQFHRTKANTVRSFDSNDSVMP
ncbi:hypothetical protein ABKN59_006108 [Abortiporus biennis]